MHYFIKVISLIGVLLATFIFAFFFVLCYADPSIIQKLNKHNVGVLLIIGSVCLVTMLIMTLPIYLSNTYFKSEKKIQQYLSDLHEQRMELHRQINKFINQPK